ncbi:putative response regulatory protein [compost metagenome]
MRALIVDDESRVRRAITLLVDWKSHGIDELQEASSGSEAIEMIRQSKPEIIIMDMMMESGNGLELMSWVNEYAGSIKFIVVSGHDDFDFVRNTVRNGGIDYILKPIDAEAINAAVSKAVAEWKREDKERSDVQRQTIQLNEFKPLYGEKMLSSFIDDPISAESTLRKLTMEGIIPKQAKTVKLLLLQVDTGDTPLLKRFANESELLHFAVINICNDFLRSQGRGIAFKYWSASSEIVILLWHQYEPVIDLIMQMNEGLFHTLQRRMHFGVSSAGDLPRSLPAQYKEALTAVTRRNLLNPGEYAHTSKPSSVGTGPASLNTGNGYIFFSSVQEDWKIAIMSGSSERIDVVSQKWVDDLSRSGIVTPELLEIWKKDIASFRTRLLREMLGDEADAAFSQLEELDKESKPPFTTGYSFSLFAWRDWSNHYMKQLSRIIMERQARENRTMMDIIKYIDYHYQTEISLQDIASHFFVSREYVSRKFKQEFGINFSDYLGQYRINKAKTLMLNPNLKVVQIAEMVGFHDVKYFSKVFKKQEGVSPKMYRSNLEK